MVERSSGGGLGGLRVGTLGGGHEGWPRGELAMVSEILNLGELRQRQVWGDAPTYLLATSRSTWPGAPT